MDDELQAENEVTVTTNRPAPDRRTAPDARTRRQPPYAVIVLNDDLHSFDYVIHALCKICGHSVMKALQLTQQVHETGRALVWSGTLELAELKRDQIREFGPDEFASRPVTFPLGVYIEPMP